VTLPQSGSQKRIPFPSSQLRWPGRQKRLQAARVTQCLEHKAAE